MDEIKRKILIVDDSDFNRDLLMDMLSDEFEILEAENGQKAMEVLLEHESEIALMLLDIVMPEMDGFEVLAMMNRKGWIKSIPVIMISAESGGAYIDRAYDLGAIDYISRPFDERTVKHRVNSNYMFSLKQNELSEKLFSQVYEREKDNSLMIEILSHIVEFRNGESGLHVLHVHAITNILLKAIVKKTGKYKLSAKDIRLISQASALHDIGKISIPSEILNKPGRFTPEEFEIMKRHTIEGANMLENLPFHKTEQLVKITYQICRWHHERYDGKGYPDGLAGDDIPIAAQVVSLADVYDALTSKRVYKPPFEPDAALEMILNGECGAFNPILLECLKDEAEELKKELGVISFGHATEDNIREDVSRIIGSDGEAPNRTFQLLQYEQMKNKYLADISREIVFEYIPVPAMLKLPDWCAEKFGLPCNIPNPAEDARWCSHFPADAFNDFIEKLHRTTLDNSVVTEQYLLNMDGEKKWYKVVAKALWNDSEHDFGGVIGKIIDVNEEVKNMQAVEDRANRDAKTGLLNHEAARRSINDILARHHGKRYMLVFFDLDNLKEINDKYGHLYGDKVIMELANRIRRSTRSRDISARMGGDEFFIFMECGKNEEAQVKRIFDCLTAEYDGRKISVSMGCISSDDRGSDYDALFCKADAAAYAVKRDGKCGYRFYDESMSTLLRNSTDIERDGKRQASRYGDADDEKTAR